jgi:hypothetical protein
MRDEIGPFAWWRLAVTIGVMGFVGLGIFAVIYFMMHWPK